jgi:hypothetical protein
VRRVELVPLARRKLDAYLKRLNESESEAWPKFLNRAWAIVAQELAKPDVAREVVLGAVAAAHHCAVAVSATALANVQSQAHREVSSAVLRIFNCIKRIRAPIRYSLDELAQTTFRDGHADWEAIFDFLKGCADLASGLPDEIDAVRIVSALGISTAEIESLDKAFRKPTLKLINDWESMHSSVRAIVEERLAITVKEAKDPPTALSARKIFSTIDHSLTIGAVTGVQGSSKDLLVAYVALVAEGWRQADLYPGRASKEGDTEYRSKFHRFLGLVLISQFDPRSRLFDRLNADELTRIRGFLASPPFDELDKEERKIVRIGPRYQWLISEHHVRPAATEPVSKKAT